jgi:hypothetical protein
LFVNKKPQTTFLLYDIIEERLYTSCDVSIFFFSIDAGHFFPAARREHEGGYQSSEGE